MVLNVCIEFDVGDKSTRTAKLSRGVAVRPASAGVRGAVRIRAAMSLDPRSKTT